MTPSPRPLKHTRSIYLIFILVIIVEKDGQKVLRRRQLEMRKPSPLLFSLTFFTFHRSSLDLLVSSHRSSELERIIRIWLSLLRFCSSIDFEFRILVCVIWFRWFEICWFDSVWFGFGSLCCSWRERDSYDDANVVKFLNEKM